MRDDHDESVLGKLGNDDCVARATHLKTCIIRSVPAADHLVCFHVVTWSELDKPKK